MTYYITTLLSIKNRCTSKLLLLLLITLYKKKSKYPRYATECRDKGDTTRNIPRCTVSPFPRYISCYILENLLPLGQCFSTITVEIKVTIGPPPLQRLRLDPGTGAEQRYPHRLTTSQKGKSVKICRTNSFVRGPNCVPDLNILPLHYKSFPEVWRIQIRIRNEILVAHQKNSGIHV